jgi:hypothetical protein
MAGDGGQTPPDHPAEGGFAVAPAQVVFWRAISDVQVADDKHRLAGTDKTALSLTR